MNPYQPFFTQVDDTIAKLEAEPDNATAVKAVDLLRRATFVIANLLNTQAQLYPHLILEPTEPTIEENDVQQAEV